MSREENQDINELKKIRLEKLAELKDMGICPFGQRFLRSAMAADIHSKYELYEGKSIKVAGR
ncbi:MAG: lysine--tRNA ligase, partial [Syntrophomonadaceae bacterium]|nr:lysine--tRNA ligase [Syntrophomonadaceae bacterium]